jgi:hypothetical protein
MPSEPGVISEELICEIAQTIPPGVASFLLTSQIDLNAKEVIRPYGKRCRRIDPGRFRSNFLRAFIRKSNLAGCDNRPILT